MRTMLVAGLIALILSPAALACRNAMVDTEGRKRMRVVTVATASLTVVIAVAGVSLTRLPGIDGGD